MILVEMKFGSHLYGTATPASDLDIKAVHLPFPRDILLQRVKPVISEHSKTDNSQKNSAEDTDYESYVLQKYLSLVAEGQTVALDMLFAPDFSFLRPASELWREIQANKDRLLTAQYASFVGYCRTQANKYGIKGSRVAAARGALTILENAVNTLGTTAKLMEIAAEVEDYAAKTEHASVLDIDAIGREPIRHLEVCGRKMPWTTSIKSARDIMAKLVAEYGQRALQAEKQEGVDWKALSHAVRIGRQAIEVLQTANVVFPRPDAAHLLAVKKGELPYQAVSEEIEALLSQIEIEAARSVLRPAPDREWIDDFVAAAYHGVLSSGL